MGDKFGRGGPHSSVYDVDAGGYEHLFEGFPKFKSRNNSSKGEHLIWGWRSDGFVMMPSQNFTLIG